MVGALRLMAAVAVAVCSLGQAAIRLVGFLFLGPVSSSELLLTLASGPELDVSSSSSGSSG